METHPNGRIKTDSAGRTNRDMIFACGDITGEKGSVAGAMASGKLAAEEVDVFLRGRRLGRKKKAPLSAPDEETIYPENVAPLMPQVPEKTFGRGQAVNISPSEDISHVLRSVGIGKEGIFGSKGSKGRVAVAGGGMTGLAAAAALAGNARYLRVREDVASRRRLHSFRNGKTRGQSHAGGSYEKCGSLGAQGSV